MAEPSGIVTDLVPYSRYKMLMVVANNGYEGPPSNMVEFTTKEGGEDTEVLYPGETDIVMKPHLLFKR